MIVPIEAGSKIEGARLVVKRRIAPCPIRQATVSVIGLGEPPRAREYFRAL